VYLLAGSYDNGLKEIRTSERTSITFSGLANKTIIHIETIYKATTNVDGDTNQMTYSTEWIVN
jgi:hypothetical protein